MKYRQFVSQEEHDNAIFSMLNQLTKRDVLYILGDIVFETEKFEQYYQQFAQLRGQIKLVIGNHDHIPNILQLTQLPHIKLIPSLISYKQYWLSHCPIHSQEFRSRVLNIHGHLHQEVVQDKRYINVNPDVNNFKLVSLDSIKEYYDHGNNTDLFTSGKQNNNTLDELVP